jgi:hypothetical protein
MLLWHSNNLQGLGTSLSDVDDSSSTANTSKRKQAGSMKQLGRAKRQKWHHRAKPGKLYAKAESLIHQGFERYLFSLTRKGRNLSKLVACFKFQT